ncbi:MAG TPA: nucleotidyltransferase domain-containing protein [Ignavibacteria bacterium]|nr:nucleotidyltransferase domain-containing protein [Ignavibacteria bacterium]
MAIKDFKDQLSDKFKKEIVSIQLFGSKARGDFTKGSDIDILVVLKHPSENRINYVYELTTSLIGKYGIYLSVKIFSEDEFNYYKSIPTRFISNILKEGKLL